MKRVEDTENLNTIIIQKEINQKIVIELGLRWTGPREF